LTVKPGVADHAARVVTSIVHVEVAQDPLAVGSAWAELEAVAPVSAYQSRAFLIPWLETIGASRGIEPLFILGRDRQDRAIALLCLGIERHGPFRVASFLGGKDSNLNLGLFHPNVAILPADLAFLFETAARSLGAATPHLFVLKNQPYEWRDTPNPLALLPHQLSPSFAYMTRLRLDGAHFITDKLSKDARKKLRKKEARLAEIGPIAVLTNDTPATTSAILNAFLAEKISRCEAQAFDVDFGAPAMRRFLEKLSMPHEGRPPWLELHALAAGDRIVATYAGAMQDKHFSCMLNSFDTDPEIAKTSPGNLLLMRLIAEKCDKGLESFDLGIGEARYKESYCDIAVPLFDVVVPVTIAGRLYAAFATAQLRVKRGLKQNAAVFAGLKSLRRLLRGSLRPGPAAD
jgi:CelD/BcsL family acetyltransferase involved in cellulose biosynthesis